MIETDNMDRNSERRRAPSVPDEVAHPKSLDEKKFFMYEKDIHMTFEEDYVKAGSFLAKNDPSKILIRPSFRAQIKKWQNSNIGDYIEYQICMQALEGQRRNWVICKRYTDFVKLHE